MTIYISQGRYTAAAIKGMSAKPEDRSEAVAELFAAAGARLISWYLTLGPFDWLIIAEAPDEPTMISAVACGRGGRKPFGHNHYPFPSPSEAAFRL